MFWSTMIAQKQGNNVFSYQPMQPIDCAFYLLAQRKKMRSQKRFFSCLLAIKIDQYIFFTETYEVFSIDIAQCDVQDGYT